MAEQNPKPDSELTPEEYMKKHGIPWGGSSSSGSTGVSLDYIPPNQRAAADKGATSFGIVDVDGTVRDFYDLNNEPGQILAGYNDIDREKITKILYSRGWYAGKEREGGLGDADRTAMSSLLYVANLKGVDWKTVLNTIAKAPISNGVSSSASQYVANTKDLVSIAQKTALSTIGRKLSEDEANRFASAYQGAQRSAATGGGMAAPGADTFFQSRIEQQYGADTEAYKYLNAISNVSQLMGSL